MLKLSEFSLKDVIDDNTGNKLGRIIDLKINQENGKIESIIVGKVPEVYLNGGSLGESLDLVG